MIGRLLRKCDFERTLAMPPCSRSAHFAVHYLPARPSAPARPVPKSQIQKLCTEHAPASEASVDNMVSGHWLGSVVPKRHAKRSVTRNLLRRQIHAAVLRHEDGLRAGLWLVRLRQPFALSTYVSAASGALRAAASRELDTLLARARQ